MIHLKLQKLQKGDYPSAHRLSVNEALTCLVSCAINSCINHSFLHLYLQFYYISVAVNWYRVGGTKHMIPTSFEVLL